MTAGPLVRVTRAALVGVLGLAGAACASSGPSAGSVPVPPLVVPGPASAYASVQISAGVRSVALNQSGWAGIAPLVAARSFSPTEALASYGLAPPAATIEYHRSAGADLTLFVGSAGFDAHFVYVMLPGKSTIYTVAADRLRSLLAEVGVVVPEPTG